jgi:tripeptide aminopeptidase
MISKKRLVDEFLRIASIDNESFDERKVADYLKKTYEELGFIVEEDDAGKKIGGNSGNLICTLKGAPEIPCVMFSAHMDSVPPAKGKHPVIKDGAIYSDGTTVLGADDIGGLAPITEAMRCIKEEGIQHGDIQVVFTVAEEPGLLGAQNIDPSKIHAQYGFVFDLDGDTGRAAMEAPMQCDLAVTYFGKASHGGIAPEKGINAISATAYAISQIETGRINENTTVNIGLIHGGTANNIVAPECKCYFDIRSLDKNDYEKQKKMIKKSYMEAEKKFGGSFEMEFEREFKGVSIEENSEIALLLKRASNDSFVRYCRILTNGGSDANVFNALFPCVAVSNGMEEIHTKNEYIKIENLIKTTKLILSITKNLADRKKQLTAETPENEFDQKPYYLKSRLSRQRDKSPALSNCG